MSVIEELEEKKKKIEALTERFLKLRDGWLSLKVYKINESEDK